MRTPIAQQFGFGDGFIDPSLYELDEELRKVDGKKRGRESLAQRTTLARVCSRSGLGHALLAF